MLMVSCVEVPDLHARKHRKHAGVRDMGWAAEKSWKHSLSCPGLEGTVGLKNIGTELPNEALRVFGGLRKKT